MTYRASIGGAFGGGAGPATAHPIDVGQILDAFTNGASTLIGNAYARKRAQAELDLNKQKADQEAQRYADQNRINEQRYNDLNTRDTARYAAQQKLERQKLRISAAASGVTLGPEFDEPSETPAPSALPPIASAMTQPSSGNVDFRVQSPQAAPLPTGDDTGGASPPIYSPPSGPSMAPSAPPIAQAFQGAAPAPVTPAPRPTTGYHPENDPKIKRAVAQAKAVEQVKLDMAPLMASADSAKAVNTARGLVPIHIGQAVATKAAELPMEIQADSIKEAHKPLNPDEGTATVQLPRMVEALNNINKLPPPSARAALTAHGGFWRNYLNSPEGQQFNQAATQAALAGALATEGPRGAQPDRVEYFKKSYVPQAGDSDQVAEQKLTAFRELARGVKIKSGRGYERIDPQTRSVIDGAIAGHGGAAPAGGATAANPFADLIPKKP